MVSNGDGTSPILLVSRRDENGIEASVSFTQTPTIIQVQMPQRHPLTLRLAWDNNRRTCLLTDDSSNTTYKVWELSQATLGPLLFA